MLKEIGKSKIVKNGNSNAARVTKKLEPFGVKEGDPLVMYFKDAKDGYELIFKKKTGEVPADGV